MKLGTKADTFYTEQATRYFALCSKATLGQKIYIHTYIHTTFFQINMPSHNAGLWNQIWLQTLWYKSMILLICYTRYCNWNENVVWEIKSNFNHWFIYNSALFSCSFRLFQNVASYKGFATIPVIPRVSLWSFMIYLEEKMLLNSVPSFVTELLST